MKTPVLKAELIRKYPELNDQIIEEGIETIALRLISMNKFQKISEAKQYIKEVLSKLLNECYRMRFSRILMSIDQTGLGLSKSFRVSVRREMVCQWSILNFFSGLNYQRSSLCKAVHGALGIIKRMPENTSYKVAQS
ncbi:hypothetical protein INR75_06790 [Zunongwangia sp. SCSIO 43204]|uniref:hypothetical protein n=1 Tax=Zunongwangia sp. SCSIO 43204 TaxID=2779359 RepID=UPI001CA93985|nr:hypothetical protein [Zunongwangia sp. SCSIO 43204]UAB85714.1 hypothetical protein INR75_06790 [Zunongwangia sp. SCSIO 43204]